MNKYPTNPMVKLIIISIFIFFSITDCSGWPLLQHSINLSKKESGNNNSLYLLLGLSGSQKETSKEPPKNPVVINPVPLSSNKDITAYSIVSPSATGTISGTNISVTVAGNTNLGSLIANFTHTGVSVKIGATTQTSGLTANNLRYTIIYTVFAQDGTSKNYTVNVLATSCTAAAFCYVFPFGPSPPGGGANFGSFVGANGDGIAGMDADCTTNAVGVGLPASNYRALLMTTGGTTIRNQTTNWVLKPNKEYRRQNGTTVIGITNSSSVFSIFSGNLTNSFVGAFVNVYSGITVSSDTSWTAGPTTCSDWTSTAATTVEGAYGNFTNTLAIGAGATQNCNTTVAVYCIEQ